MKTQICKKCQTEKDLSDFPDSKTCRSGKRGTCRKCHYELYGKNREKNLKHTSLVRNYSITESEYIGLVTKQNGRCAICGKIPDRPLCVDHNHITGVIRGLLCLNCNTGLGQFQENPILLQAAIDYLKREPLPNLYDLLLQVRKLK